MIFFVYLLWKLKLLEMNIPATISTPKVFLDPELGEFEIMGRSYPSNSLEFWKPILDSISEMTSRKFSIKIGFEYLNSSSLKFLYGLLNIFKEKHQVISIEWLCEEKDRDMEEIAKFFSEEISLPFKIIKVASF